MSTTVSAEQKHHYVMNVGDKAVNAEVQATFVMKRNLCVCMSKIDTREIEREIGTKKCYFSQATVYKLQPTTFSKGYKVTLYSDCPRAIALYAIYRNSPNLGCPKGQCGYDHYTLVFDTPP